MKKILLAITALLITVGGYAQTYQKRSTTTQDTTTQDTTAYQSNNKKHADGFMMKNGKMMSVKNQKITLLKNDTTLSNGTIVMSNGNYLKKGGTKIMLKEGQHMDLTGKIILMSDSDDQVKRMEKDKKMYLVEDSIRNKKN